MKINPQHYSMYSNDLIFSAYASSYFNTTVSKIRIGEVNDDFLKDFIQKFHCELDHETTDITFVKDKKDAVEEKPERFFYLMKNNKAFFLYQIQDYGTEKRKYASFYFCEKEKIKDLIEFSSKYKFSRTTEENQISLIVYKDKELGTHDFKIKIGEVDIKANYGESFEPKFKKIMDRLKEPEGKGIVLLHGNPGTGKTSLIKYIAKNLKKRILFVPPSMAQSLSDPEFIYFMLNYPNCVLVIEDAEKVVSTREAAGTSTAGVANILNISDGILGDCLNIQIIASFNTQRNNIDEALLRKGRLIVEHEFKALSTEDSTRLLHILGKKEIKAVRPMTLTEIYNYDESELKSTEDRKAVGFEYHSNY